MHLFVQACILGVLIGGVYALMASGLTLVFGVMRVINVAQGAMVILGAYLSYTLFTRFHIDPFLSILLIAPALFALGVGIGIATAAAAGAVFGMIYPFNPGTHYDLISRLLSIVVLGGLGSLSGAIVASLILGVSESVVAVMISPVWAPFVFFVVLI